MEVLQRTANRGSISTGGYEIDNSVKLEADNVEFMDRVITTQGNQKTWTYSGWVKRTEISFAGDGFGHSFFFGGAYGSEACLIRFNTGTTAATLDTLQIDIGEGGTLSRSHTSQVFRDTSAWYHIVLAVDTTQGTATDRFKLYVNGELVTSYYSRNNPTQNFDTGNNKAQSSTYYNNVGAYKSGGTTYGKFCGYIAESYNIDGSALAPTDFGEFDSSGIWKPKKYTGSFPNNSWYLKFDDSGALGADSSGNSNTFTLNNITSADQATDTPTNNFCTLNPLWYFEKPLIISDGATKVTSTGSPAGWQGARGSMGVANGKWYWEQKFSGSDSMGGISDSLAESDANSEGNGGGTLVIPMNDNNVYFYDPNGRAVSFTKTFSTSDIWGFALNMDDDEISFYRNGSLVNSAVALSSYLINLETFFPVVLHYSTGVTSQLNFGGYTGITISSAETDENGYGTFEYAPPTGYYALCTKNLAEFG